MGRQDRNVPELSVILPAASFETVREVVACLRAQTVADRVELVLVAPSEAGLGVTGDAGEGLAGLRVVATGGPISLLFRARATGIRAASAPIVALAETHCFPETGWAEALIEAHRGPWAAVGPALVNANPGAISWASLLLEYGPWIAPVRAGSVDNLPGHNSSYKRSELMAYGDRLETMLEAEWVMHRDMLARGLGLCVEPVARARHVSVSHPAKMIIQRLRAGRAFASARARQWSLPHRLAFAAAAPLIPPVRLRRGLRDLRRLRDRWPLPRLLVPWLVVELVLDAAGEMVGYALGGGAEAQHRMLDMDLRRDGYVTARDRRARAVAAAGSGPAAAG